MRIRAIFCCIYFSIVPWWIYEKKKHYRRTYWKHLKLNFGQIKTWLLKQETQEDIDFEKEVNPTWKKVISNMIKWKSYTKIGSSIMFSGIQFLNYCIGFCCHLVAHLQAGRLFGFTMWLVQVRLIMMKVKFHIIKDENIT